MIDEDMTYNDMGYYSIHLSKSSGKKVWAICDGCGKKRLVHFNAYRSLCHDCAMKLFSKEIKEGVANIGKSSNGYCAFFNIPKRVAIRGYFNNECFECGKTKDENKNREMSVHHVNYQKNCGCDNTQFCIYVPLCGSCHIATNNNRWFWYIKYMTELSVRNPNYYAYHIPVVYYDEPSYNYAYVFDMRKQSNVTKQTRSVSTISDKDIRDNYEENKIKHKKIYPQITVHITEDQKKRISELPEGVTFSMLFREYFDTMMHNVENKDKLDLKAV